MCATAEFLTEIVRDAANIRALRASEFEGGKRFASISVGYTHACGIEANTNAAFCWGSDNIYPKLGAGSNFNTSSDEMITAPGIEGRFRASRHCS